MLYRYFGLWGYDYYCYLLHIKESVLKLKSNSLLDIGCGDGKFVSMIKDEVKEVKGVDLSAKAIGFAKGFCEQEDIFECEDAINLNELYDVVTAIEVLEHIENKYLENFYMTLYNRVSPNGYVIISVPTINIPVAEHHYKHYDIGIFKKELQKSGVNLEIVDYSYIGKIDKIFDFIYNMLSNNKFWFIDIKFLSSKVWKHYWSKRRYANEKNGKHLIVFLKRNERE